MWTCREDLFEETPRRAGNAAINHTRTVTTSLFAVHYTEVELRFSRDLTVFEMNGNISETLSQVAPGNKRT